MLYIYSKKNNKNMQYHSALYVYIYVTFTTVPYKEKPDIISICFSMLSFVFDFSVRICSRTLESFSWSLISSSAFKVVSAFSLAGSCVLASRSSVGIIVSLLLFNFSTCNFVLFLSAVLIDLFFVLSCQHQHSCPHLSFSCYTCPFFPC